MRRVYHKICVKLKEKNYKKEAFKKVIIGKKKKQ